MAPYHDSDGDTECGRSANVGSIYTSYMAETKTRSLGTSELSEDGDNVKKEVRNRH